MPNLVDLAEFFFFFSFFLLLLRIQNHYFLPKNLMGRRSVWEACVHLIVRLSASRRGREEGKTTNPPFPTKRRKANAKKKEKNGKEK